MVNRSEYKAERMALIKAEWQRRIVLQSLKVTLYLKDDLDHAKNNQKKSNRHRKDR